MRQALKRLQHGVSFAGGSVFHFFISGINTYFGVESCSELEPWERDSVNNAVSNYTILMRQSLSSSAGVFLLSACHAIACVIVIAEEARSQCEHLSASCALRVSCSSIAPCIGWSRSPSDKVMLYQSSWAMRLHNQALCNVCSLLEVESTRCTRIVNSLIGLRSIF